MLLKEGHEGKEVYKLETILVTLGLFDNADNCFDEYTVKAVKDFQRQAGITADGIVGNTTWNYLNRANPIRHFMWHCSATREGQDFTGEDIIRWHTSPKSEGGRGWRKPGYRGVIRLDGSIDYLISFDNNNWMESSEITNGAKGMNKDTIHYCYIGGCDKNGKPFDTRTPEQLKTMMRITIEHYNDYPSIKFLGHNQVAAKACPSFSVQAYCRELHIPEKNIYKAAA